MYCLKKIISYFISSLSDSSDTGSDKAPCTAAKLKSSVLDASAAEKRMKDYRIALMRNKKQQQCRDDHNQDYDEGLGDSETGDTASSNGYHNSQAIHSDQSEDSSLTDSERTLVGDELSPRNNSPDIMGSEMDQDLEPLHAGVEVSKPECDAMLGNSEASCPVHGQDESRNMSSPEENTKDSKCCGNTECCKNLCTCAKGQTVPEPPPKRHFRAYTYHDYETGEKS